MKLLEVAETLFNDCKNLVSFSQSEVIKINSREEGYQVQDYFLEQKEKNEAGNIAGWKVALTNIEKVVRSLSTVLAHPLLLFLYSFLLIRLLHKFLLAFDL